MLAKPMEAAEGRKMACARRSTSSGRPRQWRRQCLVEALEQGGQLGKGRGGCGVRTRGSRVAFMGKGATGEGQAVELGRPGMALMCGNRASRGHRRRALDPAPPFCAHRCPVSFARSRAPPEGRLPALTATGRRRPSSTCAAAAPAPKLAPGQSTARSRCHLCRRPRLPHRVSLYSRLYSLYNAESLRHGRKVGAGGR